MMQRRGQTLLEVSIAIGIIISSVAASTTLIISTIGAGRISQSSIEATNFAREGIEAVQQVRDSNWLKRAQNIGDDPPCATPDCIPETVQWDDRGRLTDGYAPMGSESAFECNPAQSSVTERFRALFSSSGWQIQEESHNGPCANQLPPNLDVFIIYEIVNFQQIPVLYSQNNVAVFSRPTKYRRIINVTKGFETIGSCVNCLEYLNVVSEVFWRDRTGNDSAYPGFNRRVVARKRFYNWQ